MQKGGKSLRGDLIFVDQVEAWSCHTSHRIPLELILREVKVATYLGHDLRQRLHALDAVQILLHPKQFCARRSGKGNPVNLDEGYL